MCNHCDMDRIEFAQRETAMSDTVWLIESGEYENRGVDLVAATPEAGFEGIKEMYDNGHYIVEWTMEKGHLVGSFESVKGWSIKHRAIYEATEWTLTQ